MSLDLQAIEAIKQLKYRYVRALDSADLDTMRTCLAENVYVRFEGGIYTFEHTGREKVIAAFETSFHSKAAASHQVHHPEILLQDETHARAKWSLSDIFHDLNQRIIISGAAEYEDDYVKDTEGNWQIVRSTYTRLYEMTQPMPENMFCTVNKLATTGKDLGL